MYEKEADQVADQVVQRLAEPNTVNPAIENETHKNSEVGNGLKRSPLTTSISMLLRQEAPDLEKEAGKGPEEEQQRKPIFESPGIGDEPIQRKCATCEVEEGIQPKRLPALQRSGDGSLQASDDFSTRLQSFKGGGQSLPQDTQASMEGAIGADFSNVRVHTGSEAAGLSQEIGAQAFTHGSDIYFNEGKYDPASSSGQHLLAHELTHTVQQGGSGEMNTPQIQRGEADTSIGCEGLENLASDLNSIINRVLNLGRKKYPNNELKIIEFVYLMTASALEGKKTPIEEWVEGQGPTKKYKPSKEGSKYGKYITYGAWDVANTGFWKPDVIAPTINVNGFCIGGDKLGHFFQQGKEYYDLENEESAKKYGMELEMGKYGLGYGRPIFGSGVLSFADLEANIQGMKFYNELASNIDLVFNILDYVNSDWNEESNPNFYHPEVADTVWGNLLKDTWKGTMTDFDTGESTFFTVGLAFQGDPGPLGMSMLDEKYQDMPINGNFIFGNPDDFKNQKVGFFENGILTMRMAENIGKDAVEGVKISFTWSEMTTGQKGLGILKSKGENQLNGVMLFESEPERRMDLQLNKGTGHYKEARGSTDIHQINAGSQKVIMTQDPGNYKTDTEKVYLETGVQIEILDKGANESFNQTSPEFHWYKVKVLSDGKLLNQIGWVSNIFIE